MKKFLNKVKDMLKFVIEILEEDDKTKTAVSKKRGCGCGGKDKKRPQVVDKKLDNLKSKLFN